MKKISLILIFIGLLSFKADSYLPVNQLCVPASGPLKVSDLRNWFDCAGCTLSQLHNKGKGSIAPPYPMSDFYGECYHSIAPGDYNAADTGASFNLSLITYGAWTLADDATWITLSAASGTGDGSTETVGVTVASNGGSLQRTGTITFTRGSYSVTCTVVQAGSSGVATTAVSLGNGTSNTLACDDFTTAPSTFYIPQGETFGTATALYLNSSGTTLAASGWYSDGSLAREWNGNTFITDTSCAPQ